MLVVCYLPALPGLSNSDSYVLGPGTIDWEPPGYRLSVASPVIGTWYSATFTGGLSGVNIERFSAIAESYGTLSVQLRNAIGDVIATQTGITTPVSCPGGTCCTTARLIDITNTSGEVPDTIWFSVSDAATYIAIETYNAEWDAAAEVTAPIGFWTNYAGQDETCP